MTFATARDAMDFLVCRIDTEAQLEGDPLSDLERKMLYFSETAWTLPDMEEVSAAFDREYNLAEYEERIGKLIRNLSIRDRKENRDDSSWIAAVHRLRSEDHYILVLIDNAMSSRVNHPTEGQGTRFLKLLLIGFLLACVIVAIGFLFLRLR